MGRGRHAASRLHLLRQLETLIYKILKLPDITGYTYTQLTYSEQEVYSRLTLDHCSKIPIGQIMQDNDFVVGFDPVKTFRGQPEEREP